MLEQMKEVVCQGNKSLKELQLVKWTSGNVSWRDPATNQVIIKPSGVHFDALTPEKMVVMDLDGNVIEGNLKPSVDSLSHLYVYRHMPEVNSVIHTHSPFATSFAIRGIPLKTYTTTGANLFREGVPCSNFATIGEEAIGKEIVALIGESPAILLRNHGVFTIGKTVATALKTAVILEETAEYAHYATLHDEHIPPLSKEIVTSCYAFYNSSYGQ